ncbi:MAG TPA: histidine kinase dimerization/phospho-acceptor domain-containing protein [Candidatus Acidoferrales bacterium]|jgi:signal transduction histidine kinase|nr:histidine kinase dimerization/phospho-acceptor domain-containing protein [Candidatus Acidoferrales bacterium]
MISEEREIFLVCAEEAVTQSLVRALLATGGHYQLPLAFDVSQACRAFRHSTPAVILFDESAVNPATGESASTAIARLTGHAPVVAVVAPERQSELAFLISSGAVDFVVRLGDFVPIAVAFLERRARLAARAGSSFTLPEPEMLADFGEVLRHEINNPLTGILGNAELLITEFKRKNGERLPPSALHRLETITELAVRLRETVRRLSDAWENRHAPARSA